MSESQTPALVILFLQQLQQESFSQVLMRFSAKIMTHASRFTST